MVDIGQKPETDSTGRLGHANVVKLALVLFCLLRHSYPMHRRLIVVFCVGLSGCTGGSSSLLNEMLVYPATDPATITTTDSLLADAVLMRRVNGYSCGGGPLMGVNHHEAAIDDAKREAAQIGATGIYRLKSGATGIIDGCLAGNGFHATGLAFYHNTSE